MLEVVLAIAGIYLGCLCRTMLPYLKKLRDNPDMKFDKKFKATLVFNLIISGIATVLVMANMKAISGEPWIVFAVGFSSGWGAQDIINRMVK